MNLNAKLEKTLREYYEEEQCTGLCCWVNCEGGDDLMEVFYKFAFKWPDSLKTFSGNLESHFIPFEKGSKCRDTASLAYISARDFRESPMRLEFANFVLKEIARKEKKKFVPIVFDKPAKL